MPNNLTRFHNKFFDVRALQDNDTIWFVAKDVCEALNYSKTSSISQLLQIVPDIWKGIKRIDTPGGEQDMLCLTEQGLYFFLGRSDKKKATQYQMWIAGDVVPSIRKNGFYATPDTIENIIADPDTFIRLLQEYKKEKT